MNTSALLVASVCSFFCTPVATATDSVSPDEARKQEVLQKWQAASQGVRTYHASGRRYAYDSVFETETRGTFEHAFVESNCWIMRTNGTSLTEDAVSQRMDRKGHPYEVRSELSDIWYSDGESVSQASVSQKLYCKTQIARPNESVTKNDFRSGSFWNRLREFTTKRPQSINRMFGLTPDFWNTHEFQLNEEDTDVISMTATPTRDDLLSQYASLQFRLDAKTYRVKALKVTERTGNRESVYVLEHVQINGDLDESSSVFEVPWDSMKELTSSFDR